MTTRTNRTTTVAEGLLLRVADEAEEVARLSRALLMAVDGQGMSGMLESEQKSALSWLAFLSVNSVEKLEQTIAEMREAPLAKPGVKAAAAGAGAASSGHPDAELLALGETLETAWAKEKEAFAALPYDYANETADALTGPAAKLCARILAMQAATLDGLKVKARCVTWCWSGRLPRADDGPLEERLLASIARDLVVMAAPQDAGAL